MCYHGVYANYMGADQIKDMCDLISHIVISCQDNVTVIFISTRCDMNNPW